MREKKEESVIEHVDDDESSGWTDMPRAAKVVVYETLREAACHYEKESAVHALSANGQKSVASSILSAAFAAAIVELEDLDEELCEQCGNYHPVTTIPEPSKDPKDLS